MKEVLIKTFKAEDYKYAKALLEQGELFFQHVDNFRIIENDKQRNDPTEGQMKERLNLDIDSSVKQFFFGDSDCKQIRVDWASIVEKYPEFQGQKLEFKLTYITDLLIYCMTYVNSSMNENDLQKIFNTIRELGDYSVVITDCDYFIKTMKEQIDLVKGQLVTYTNGEIISPFMKRSLYEGQSEFRFAIKAEGQNNKIVKLGGIRGFICESAETHFIKSYLQSYH